MSLLSLHLCLPLAGIILLAYIKNNKGLYITHLLISFFSFLLAIKIFLEKDFYLEYSLNIFNIIPNISISFSVDGLGMVFLLVSNFLWLMTTIYSERYLISQHLVLCSVFPTIDTVENQDKQKFLFVLGNP